MEKKNILGALLIFLGILVAALKPDSLTFRIIGIILLIIGVSLVIITVSDGHPGPIATMQ